MRRLLITRHKSNTLHRTIVQYCRFKRILLHRGPSRLSSHLASAPPASMAVRWPAPAPAGLFVRHHLASTSGAHCCTAPAAIIIGQHQLISLFANTRPAPAPAPADLIVHQCLASTSGARCCPAPAAIIFGQRSASASGHSLPSASDHLHQ